MIRRPELLLRLLKRRLLLLLLGRREVRVLIQQRRLLGDQRRPGVVERLRLTRQQRLLLLRTQSIHKRLILALILELLRRKLWSLKIKFVLERQPRSKMRIDVNFSGRCRHNVQQRPASRRHQKWLWQQIVGRMRKKSWRRRRQSFAFHSVSVVSISIAALWLAELLPVPLADVGAVEIDADVVERVGDVLATRRQRGQRHDSFRLEAIPISRLLLLAFLFIVVV